MKPLSSVITGLPLAAPSSIGMLPSASGSGALVPWAQRDPALHVPPVPPWLTPIVTSSVAYWATWLAMKRTLPPDTSKEHLCATLHDAVLGVRQMHAPASPQKIGKTLEGMAQVFRAALPEDLGLRGYIHALQDLPAIAFDEAARALIRTHRYPNLPLPAEFHAAAEKTVQLLQLWDERLVRANGHALRL